MADDEAAGGGDSAMDLTNTAAYYALDELHADGRLTEAAVASYKSKYAELHEFMLQSFEDEKSLMKQAKQLNQQLLAERIKLERQSIRRNEENLQLNNLEKEKEKAQKELDECQDRDTMLTFEISELQREQQDMTRRLEGMRQENAALVQPEIQRLTEELDELRGESARHDAAFEADTRRREELEQRILSIETAVAQCHNEKQAQRVLLRKLDGDPERVKKQADVVQKAAESLESEVQRLRDRIDAADVGLQQHAKKRKESEDSKKEVARKLEQHRDAIEARQRDVEAVRKNLDFELAQHLQHQSARYQLELERKHDEEDHKAEVERLASVAKEFEQLKRKLKKKQVTTEQLRMSLPNLRMQLTDVGHQVNHYKLENRQYRQTLLELKQEVDMFIAKFLRQEGVETAKKEALGALRDLIRREESDISQWSAEEHQQNKMIQMLSAQREVKAREASKAMQNERETQEDLKMKELIILDLTKKCNETNNRLKEFSALYDVVKNERNKYVNLIQASSQALAEMKEKIKILQNEVEILRNESLAKDKALSKERQAHQSSQAARDALRLESNKCHAQYRSKQQQVEQQIVEIDKLNSIINAMERDMLQLKQKYEMAVEARNYTGVQLIDRNDELCILYEKSNIQEQTLNQGEVGIRGKDEEIRGLKLQLKELQRRIEVTRKQMPLMPEYAEQILALQQELASEREMTETLCRDLETPKNNERWRPLDGDDPDLEQLTAKVQVLEERLNDKKEQLLEKELVLQEVTSLSDKLRAQAAEGRSDTLQLAKRVNEFQARIKEVTRRMMATVSELSMFQATAMKLQQEKHDREMELEDATWQLDHGEAPTEEAEHEWYRLERERLRREEERYAKLQASHAQAAAGSMPALATRTTADPRPNAYLPSDNVVPKPYGTFAPFKPTEAGSSMRHIRNPAPQEIVI